jgi:hypothetical protein
VSPQDLIDAAEAVASRVDTLGETFAGELTTVLRRLERRLRPLVVDALSGSPLTIIRARASQQLRKLLESTVDDAGFSELAADAYGDRLDLLVDDVLSARAESVLTNAFQARVDALKALHATDLLDEGADIAKELWQATVRGVFIKQPVDRILSDLYDVIDSSEAQIRTLYDTSVSIFGRQIEALQAGDDPETPFAYFGPADEKTRPFCLLHVGKVYTRAEIDQMDNGQIDNVFLTGGGYNCRHTWIEVSAFSSLTNLIGTGKRVAEVEAQVAA